MDPTRRLIRVNIAFQPSIHVLAGIDSHLVEIHADVAFRYYDYIAGLHHLQA